MIRLLLPVMFFLFAAMQPFWDKSGEAVVVSASMDGLHLCAASNHYLFRKNSTGACYAVDTLFETLEAIAAEKNKKVIKLVFANSEKQYITPDVKIDDKIYRLHDLLYYARSKTVYLEVTSAKKYYFFRLPARDLRFE